jgi:UDP-N-acetylglucosamine 2-epimerase (non-hydrolysing)
MMKELKIDVVVGTRPEIIKLSPVLMELEKRNITYRLTHTGQHYSYNLDKIFFKDLELREPDSLLGIGSGTQGEQTGKILIKMEKVLLEDKPDLIIIEGDTNSVLASALAAVKINVKVAHVEAGLRSFDRRMPEELNRILTDHISHYLFAPTEIALDNLLKEGISEDKIFMTGNTIVDATLKNLDIAREQSAILSHLGLKEKSFFLLTLHRVENVDNKERLEKIIRAIKKVSKDFLIIFPIHPRAEKQLHKFGLTKRVKGEKKIKVIQPVGYIDFLTLELNARLVLTDSGGIQEEACILKTPCVTLRERTERPETVVIGSNVVTGFDEKSIIDGVEGMLAKKLEWKQPFGDGKAATRIIDILLQNR